MKKTKSIAKHLFEVMQKNHLDEYKNITDTALERFIAFMLDTIASSEVSSLPDSVLRELNLLYLDLCIKEKSKQDVTLSENIAKVIREMIGKETNVNINLVLTALVDILTEYVLPRF